MTVIPFPETRQGCSCKDPEWIRLPVAPQAAARSRFHGDGKLPAAIPLQGALTWISDRLAGGIPTAGIDIHGPGDPLATSSMTLKILTTLQQQNPDLALGITTLGLGLAEDATELAQKGVTKLTLLADAVEPETVQKLYAWIRPGRKNIPLATGAGILLEEQEKAVSACIAAGMEVAVQTTVYPGFNDHEITEIARRFSALGARSMTLLPGKGWLEPEKPLPAPTAEALDGLAQQAGQHIKTVCVEVPQNGGELVSLAGQMLPSMPKPTGERPNAAVLSSNGMDIDLHLGQAIKALIYGPREDGLACLLEARDLPEPGSGDTRWLTLADILQDCFVLLAASAGQKPRNVLERNGIALLLLEDNVEGTVDALFGGGKKGRNKK